MSEHHINHTIEKLKAVHAFRELPEPQLAWLLTKSKVVTYLAGDKIFNKNTPFTNMRVVLEGTIAISLEQKGHYREIARIEAGEITGILPYSRADRHVGAGVAAKPTVILELHKEHFPEMIQFHHELVEALVHNMISRVREYSQIRHHDEKLLSLGKLSAGLAHELNNPSSAMIRSARELKKNVRTAPSAVLRIVSAGLSAQQMKAVNALLLAKIEQQHASESISLMQKTAQIDEMADWLESHGLEDGYGIAETLFECQFTVAELVALLDTISEDHVAAVVGWMNDVLTSEKLVQDIDDAAARIADLVNAVKTYTHLDKAPDKQPTEIRQGLTSTLTMLNHKLKSKNIQVELNVPDEVPGIHAFIGELNQVWTNIIDNAIDAMDKDGKLEITAARDGESVLVTIADNGCGISEEHQAHIFDPFFTTKSVGEGTGLGLDIVHKIIQHHNGYIKVSSRPGRTEFRISLPIK